MLLLGRIFQNVCTDLNLNHWQGDHLPNLGVQEQRDYLSVVLDAPSGTARKSNVRM